METKVSLPVLSFFDIEKFLLNLGEAVFGRKEPAVLGAEDYKLGIREDDIPYVKSMFGRDSVEINSFKNITPLRKKRIGREICYRGRGDVSLSIFDNDLNVRGFTDSLKNSLCSCLELPTEIRVGDLIVETGMVYGDLFGNSEEDVENYEEVSLRLKQPLIRHDKKIIPKGRVKLRRQTCGYDLGELEKNYSLSIFSGISKEEFEEVLPVDWFLKSLRKV